MRYFAVPGFPHPMLPVFSPCGRWLYGNGLNGLAMWDMAGTSSKQVWEDFESGFFLFRLVVSPCGRYLAGAEDRCVVIWDMVERGEPKWLSANESGDHISDVAFTPDGKELLTACIDGGGIRRWTVGNWKQKPAFGRRAYLDGALVVSPDGKMLATVWNHAGKQPGIRLWSYPGCEVQLTAPRDGERYVHLAYSPDGAFLAANDDWKCVRVWNARTVISVAEYTPRIKTRRKTKQPVHSFAFHPSGKILAVAGAGPVEFLDTTTWQPIQAFDWKLGPSYGIAFSPDGTLAAAGSDKGKVVVWDVDL